MEKYFLHDTLPKIPLEKELEGIRHKLKVQNKLHVEALVPPGFERRWRDCVDYRCSLGNSA